MSRFEVLPDKGTPIIEWQPESKGWQNVVDGICDAVDKIRAQANIPSERAQNVQLAEWIFQQGNFLLMLKQFNKVIECVLSFCTEVQTFVLFSPVWTICL